MKIVYFNLLKEYRKLLLGIYGKDTIALDTTSVFRERISPVGDLHFNLAILVFSVNSEKRIFVLISMMEGITLIFC